MHPLLSAAWKCSPAAGLPFCLWLLDQALVPRNGHSSHRLDPSALVPEENWVAFPCYVQRCGTGILVWESCIRALTSSQSQATGWQNWVLIGTRSTDSIFFHLGLCWPQVAPKSWYLVYKDATGISVQGEKWVWSDKRIRFITRQSNPTSVLPSLAVKLSTAACSKGLLPGLVCDGPRLGSLNSCPLTTQAPLPRLSFPPGPQLVLCRMYNMVQMLFRLPSSGNPAKDFCL